jgi:hypothetical protein
MNIRIPGIALLFCLAFSSSSFAQSYHGDARKIGMGGSGYAENIATSMIEEERSYSSIVIPLGLIQLARDFDHFDPDDKAKFDPVLALEYAANPIHYTFGRNPEGPRGKFIREIVNGDLSRNLNDYHGINFANHLKSEGLASPSWGKTFKFRKRDTGAFQGFYVGVGPYFSAGTDLNIDKGLTDVLASATDIAIPNRNFVITDQSRGQLAMAVTGGYRARFSLPSQDKDSPDGVYVGINYNYLRGFQYLGADTTIRMDTDNAGLLWMLPTTEPVNIDYLRGKSGAGYSIDFGMGLVVKNWEFGFGAKGVANRIDWSDFTHESHKLASLINGGDFQKQTLASPSELRVELPIQYTGNIGYDKGKYAFVAEIADGFQGTSFHGGGEFRLKWIEFRGGVRYGLDRWHPSGGIGFNLGNTFSIDVAAFGTTTNIERRLLPALAVSFRINHAKKERS